MTKPLVPTKPNDNHRGVFGWLPRPDKRMRGYSRLESGYSIHLVTLSGHRKPRAIGERPILLDDSRVVLARPSGPWWRRREAILFLTLFLLANLVWWETGQCIENGHAEETTAPSPPPPQTKDFSTPLEAPHQDYFQGKLLRELRNQRTPRPNRPLPAPSEAEISPAPSEAPQGSNQDSLRGKSPSRAPSASYRLPSHLNATGIILFLTCAVAISAWLAWRWRRRRIAQRDTLADFNDSLARQSVLATPSEDVPLDSDTRAILGQESEDAREANPPTHHQDQRVAEEEKTADHRHQPFEPADRGPDSQGLPPSEPVARLDISPDAREKQPDSRVIPTSALRSPGSFFDIRRKQDSLRSLLFETDPAGIRPLSTNRDSVAQNRSLVEDNRPSTATLSPAKRSGPPEIRLLPHLSASEEQRRAPRAQEGKPIATEGIRIVPRDGKFSATRENGLRSSDSTPRESTPGTEQKTTRIVDAEHGQRDPVADRIAEETATRLAWLRDQQRLVYRDASKKADSRAWALRDPARIRISPPSRAMLPWQPMQKPGISRGTDADPPPRDATPANLPATREKDPLMSDAGAESNAVSPHAAPTRPVAQSPTAPLTRFRNSLENGEKGPEMMLLPAGEFLMGSPEDEPARNSDEGPRHRVWFAKPFALGVTVVTFEEYDRFARATGRRLPNDWGWGRGSRPVIDISWWDAMAYAEWLSKETREKYRLPTEAEWEYAARAMTATPFSTGERIDSAQANYDGTHGYNGPEDKGEIYRRKTVPAGTLPGNPWGLHEMHGNVCEWTADYWHGSYRDAPNCGSAWTEENEGNSSSRVVRGGSWSSRPQNLRAASRDRSGPDEANYFIGFRIAREC
uniref:Formylglycine-generating enzyme, required for sulfatase activity, contains SUMF1/FGE domain n=1 Tax=Candidatus Kentrum sp. SD TaxID=2126332 RepID=A0A450Y676_9GAMM|nr:MAG: Formylglycine-generating enzyme, required for sulfatase activity, contains SUMF1/FGE domain [Candidatus Kentron sp. SD]VFK43070.1 MAG: Formylglycine-generating enzyme, required for sulfatase activity, contains SUMF1/FGE domain [Candidatus Kentron sp. SD]